MTVAFLINRMLTRVIDYQTPLRTLSRFHSIPSASNLYLKFFGCVFYVYVHAPHMDKLEPRALKYVFLGYSNSRKGYKCFHPPSKKYCVFMDVQFSERVSYFSIDVSLVPLQREISSKEE